MTENYTNSASRENQNEMPFQSVLSLKKLFDTWEEKIEKKDPLYYPFYNEFKEISEKYSYLKKEIPSTDSIKEIINEINFLFYPVLPNALSKDIIILCTHPFHFAPFLFTDKFFEGAKEICINESQVEKSEKQKRAMTAYLYSRILKKFYDQDIQFEISYDQYFQKKDSDLLKVFQLEFPMTFIEIIAEKNLPKLSSDDLTRIRANIFDIDFLTEKLPPDIFLFEGFSISIATDITEREITSLIKNTLVNAEALTSKEQFVILQNYIRSLLSKPDLVFEIAALNDDMVLMLNTGAEHDEDIECVYKDSKHIPVEYFKDTIHEKAVFEKKPILVNDLSKISMHEEIKKKLLSENVGSIIFYPLIHNGDSIGLVIFYIQGKSIFTYNDIYRLDDIMPVFTIALYRIIEEFDNRMTSIIQKEFTSIHQSIAWRFRKASMQYIEKISRGENAIMEEIVFDHVYPLYAVSDIRSSSHFRNEAIHNDLKYHLKLIEDILRKAYKKKALPVLDEMLFRINIHKKSINESLSTGDELEILSFIKRDIEPFLPVIEKLSSDIKDLIQAYHTEKNPEYGTIYKDRKDFDESVAQINTAISSYLESAQPEAQNMFPHYFEKSSTDGVDFNIYIGQSMSNRMEFDRIYLKNLRLWQLIIMCRIAHLAYHMKTSLAIQLQTTHLIVVQDMPISVRFNKDDNSLDVEGAYNIRYEIMKKRIDKAVIKGSGERLTQPDQIAIVYSQNQESAEYTDYIEYLISKNYIHPDYGDYNLEDMQGIHGLRALRIKVNMQNEEFSDTYKLIDQFKR